MYKIKKNKAISGVFVCCIFILIAMVVSYITYKVSLNVSGYAVDGTYGAYETLTGNKIEKPNRPEDIAGGMGTFGSNDIVTEEREENINGRGYEFSASFINLTTDMSYTFIDGKYNYYSTVSQSVAETDYLTFLQNEKVHKGYDVTIDPISGEYRLYLEGKFVGIIKDSSWPLDSNIVWYNVYPNKVGGIDIYYEGEEFDKANCAYQITLGFYSCFGEELDMTNFTYVLEDGALDNYTYKELLNGLAGIDCGNDYIYYDSKNLYLELGTVHSDIIATDVQLSDKVQFFEEEYNGVKIKVLSLRFTESANLNIPSDEFWMIFNKFGDNYIYHYEIPGVEADLYNWFEFGEHPEFEAEFSDYGEHYNIWLTDAGTGGFTFQITELGNPSNIPVGAKIKGGTAYCVSVGEFT